MKDPQSYDFEPGWHPRDWEQSRRRINSEQHEIEENLWQVREMSLWV